MAAIREGCISTSLSFFSKIVDNPRRISNGQRPLECPRAAVFLLVPDPDTCLGLKIEMCVSECVAEVERVRLPVVAHAL